MQRTDAELYRLIKDLQLNIEWEDEDEDDDFEEQDCDPGYKVSVISAEGGAWAYGNTLEEAISNFVDESCREDS